MSRILPILFNTEMVRAILDGRKTVTRRTLKLQKHVRKQENGLYTLFAEGTCYEDQYMENILMYIKPPYQQGDILYIRETWQCWRAHRYEATADIIFKAGGDRVTIQFANGGTDFACRNDYDDFVKKWYGHQWHPSIHMPKEVARIWLKVTDVRLERLQDITEEQAEMEGCGEYQTEAKFSVSPRCHFYEVWESTIKASDKKRYGWEANPFVWVIEFERCEKPSE